MIANFLIYCFIVGIAYWKFKQLNLVKNTHQQQKTELLQAAQKTKSKRILICFGTQTNNAKNFAKKLQQKLSIITTFSGKNEVSLLDLKQFEPELFTNADGRSLTILILMPSYENGTPPQGSEWFYQWLIDAKNDFRVSKHLLKHCEYSVFGLGHSEYGHNFNAVARQVDGALCYLGAKRIAIVGLGDFAQDIEADFNRWVDHVVMNLETAAHLQGSDSNNEDFQSVVHDSDNESADEQVSQSDSEEMVDVEDMGIVAKKLQEVKSDQPKKITKMVTPLLHKALTKQGYKIVGSHSGVKICRWTKAMLRGRGGCYKHTNYGIASHQCMETTPSLACASKCVFCIGEGTLISLADGSRRPIEQLVGQHRILTALLSEDQQQHSIIHGESIELLNQGQKECVQLLLSNGDSLVCTPDHLICTARGWVKVQELLLHSQDNKDLIMVSPQQNSELPGENRIDSMPVEYSSVQHIKSVGVKQVYDLSVPGTHNFIAGNVVVHNCWRHSTNPVGTSWKWEVDEPKAIIEGVIDGHYSMIKQMRGVPGVRPERMQEAFNIRHCALSLVGEPIMYPYINEFVEMLHERRISSFLVTNAQFPEAIASLRPVTQLYVSIDASNKESLKKIDRPLFGDYWERFVGCLQELSKKGQRTVYRLTLVKDYNLDDLPNYAKLVKIGRPDFIEVKGVTFCGYSPNNPLRMSNVPYQHEVIAFSEKLGAEIGDEYEIACEHEHSCSILLAHRKFKINDKWHTWIDYDKFHELVSSGRDFDAMDYVAPTPDWAVYGNEHRGFDPEEERFRRKQNSVANKGEIPER